MRILTVTHFFESHGGGIERVAAQLCRQFARDGHQPVWAASSEDDAPGEPVEIVPLRCANPMERWTGLPMPIPGPRGIRDLARAITDSDAVIIHDALYVTSIVAMLLAKCRGKSVVLIQHIGVIAFANPVMRIVMQLANRVVTRPMLFAADRLVFISNEVRRELLGNPPRRDSLLLFNGVESSVFRFNGVPDVQGVRLRHNLPTDVKLALFVGRFVAKKGLSVLEAIARERPDLHIAMIGSGPIRPESWHLPNVHVLGPRSRGEIAELYGACDLLLLPSVGEGYPLVIQEAMACGLAVVCGDRSARADAGAARWLRGVEIELGDPRGSARRCFAAMDCLFANPVDRVEMSSYAARTYDWSAMARAIEQSVLSRIQVIDTAAGGLQPG